MTGVGRLGSTLQVPGCASAKSPVSQCQRLEAIRLDAAAKQFIDRAGHFADARGVGCVWQCAWCALWSAAVCFAAGNHAVAGQPGQAGDQALVKYLCVVLSAY
jgi:hypothetical protein